MTPTIAVISPGAMGSAVARRLSEHGARVLTGLAGRSPATCARAAAAGMIGVGDDQIAAADVILSILPPAEAVGFAERLAPILALGGRQPIFVDCNAVDVRTVERIAAIIGAGPARFVDGAIIGAPPQPGKPGPTFYFSGAAAAELDWLQQFGLKVHRLDVPSARLRPSRCPMPASPRGSPPWPPPWCSPRAGPAPPRRCGRNSPPASRSS